MPTIHPSDTQFLTDCGTRINNVISAQINLQADGFHKVLLECGAITDSDFIFLNERCQISINSDKLQDYPSQMLAKELQKRQK